jgi:hypothetical protein
MGYSRLMGEDKALTARWFANIAKRKGCARHARSEMPHQDSQVTVDGRMRVIAGLIAGAHGGRQ